MEERPSGRQKNGRNRSLQKLTKNKPPPRLVLKQRQKEMSYFNLLFIHPGAPNSTIVVRIRIRVKRFIPWRNHGLPVLIKPLQHRINNSWLVLSLVDIFTRIVYDVKQTRAQLMRALGWRGRWLATSNDSIFQGRTSGGVIRVFKSGGSIPSAPTCAWG